MNDVRDRQIVEPGLAQAPHVLRAEGDRRAVRAADAATMVVHGSPTSALTPSSRSRCTSSLRLECAVANRACTEARKMQPFTRDAASADNSRSARGNPLWVL